MPGGAARGRRGVGRPVRGLVGAPHSPGWLPAAELFGAALPAALAAVGLARGTDNPAVSGTLLFEQYAQRLVAPVLAALHRDGTVVDARMPGVRAELAGGAVRRLAFARPPEPCGPQRREADVATADALVAGNLDLAAEAVHHQTRVGMRVLRGAVANAVASSFLHMSWPAADRARYVPEARAFLARVPGLAKLVTVQALDGAGGSWMYTDRSTCCLAFRTTVNQTRDQQFCSTCPVLPRATIHALFARATATYAARTPRS